MSHSGKPLYVVGEQASLRLDGNSLRVLRPGKSESRVPLRRVSRAVIRTHENDQLQACLAIVREGGIVHFVDGNGHICGMLQQPGADGSHWARELADNIDQYGNSRPYQQWRKNQQKHAWSLVFRRGYCGDFDANRKRLLRYLLFHRPELKLQTELQWLEEQLLAWLHARIASEGLYPVVRAVNSQGEQLVNALRPCLFIPLLWRYVRWRRQRATAMVAERTDFFELQAAAPLCRQLDRHIRALEAEYEGVRLSQSSLDTCARELLSLP